MLLSVVETITGKETWVKKKVSKILKNKDNENPKGKVKFLNIKPIS